MYYCFFKNDQVRALRLLLVHWYCSGVTLPFLVAFSWVPTFFTGWSFSWSFWLTEPGFEVAVAQQLIKKEKR